MKLKEGMKFKNMKSGSIIQIKSIGNYIEYNLLPSNNSYFCSLEDFEIWTILVNAQLV